MKKLTFLLAALVATTMSAQELDIPTIGTLTELNDTIEADTISSLRHYKHGDNYFITPQIGVNAAIGENVRFNDLPKTMDYFVGVSAGKYINPNIAARIFLGFGQMHGRANEESLEAYPDVFDDGIYDVKSFMGYLDVVLNFSNILCGYKESRRFNGYGFVGIGGLHSFDYSRNVISWRTATNGKYQVERKAGNYYAARAGLGCHYKLNEPFDLTFEMGISAVDDGYNGVRYDDRYDGYLFALLGLTYHFTDHYGDHRFKFTAITDADQIRLLNDEINNQRRRLFDLQHPQAAKSELLEMTVSFEIDKYNITDIQKKNVAEVAKYMEEHPNVNIAVCGYADVQTAYPAYNMKLSKRRATAVRNMLIRDFGVDKNRVRVDYKGDAIQPYKEANEWNRVVVFLSEPVIIAPGSAN